jgi:hypothetical protein
MTDRDRYRRDAHLNTLCRAGLAGIIAAAPLAISTRPAIVSFGVLTFGLLITRHGAGMLAGGLSLVAEVGLAVGRSDSLDALIVAGVVGAALVAFATVTTIAPVAPSIPTQLWVELAVGGFLAALATTAGYTGAGSVFIGLFGAAVLIGTVAVRGDAG